MASNKTAVEPEVVEPEHDKKEKQKLEGILNSHKTPSKRLYALRGKNGKLITDSNKRVLYFGGESESRTQARKMRNLLLETSGLSTFITKGPDHRHYTSEA